MDLSRKLIDDISLLKREYDKILKFAGFSLLIR